MTCAENARFHGAPHGGARGCAYKRFAARQNLDAGRIHSARADQNALGVPTGFFPWGMAGAHIAELIKTMLEKKASGIDLKL
ncbi:MAG TPA: hypothetical protein IAA94_00365 [Candidatus Galloscillospira stercoripullorum]|nr:hypothetical protein [Candidatus Galloscillospira stercoripullorum]